MMMKPSLHGGGFDAGLVPAAGRDLRLLTGLNVVFVGWAPGAGGAGAASQAGEFQEVENRSSFPFKPGNNEHH